MPWFKIDDKAHSHPKFMRAGNAALGLWLRCGSYSAQHLTEGVVPGVVAQLYGTAPQAAKLVKVGMWHEYGHDCDRCQQPQPGDYVIHDFFEGGRNTTRAQYEANKKGAADRAAKSRAGRKASGIEDESSSKTDRFEDESKTNRLRKEPHFQEELAGQDDLSHRTPADGVTHPHAMPCHNPVLPTEVPPASSGSDRPPTGGVPDRLQPLRDALAAAGLGAVAWDIKQFSDWERIRIQVDRLGIAVMVRSASNAARRRGEPDSVTAWIGRWESLADTPADSNGEVVPIHNAASRQQQETDDQFDRAMQRAKARMQQESS